LLDNKIKILIADDDEDIREILDILLKAEGFSTVMASDGKQAIELAAGQRYSGNQKWNTEYKYRYEIVIGNDFIKYLLHSLREDLRDKGYQVEIDCRSIIPPFLRIMFLK
jgi:CheY-like chemotaxis protein